MAELALKNLPSSMRGSTVGVLSPSVVELKDDLEALECKIVAINPYEPNQGSAFYPDVDVFVLDGSTIAPDSYVIDVQSILKRYQSGAQDRFCYAVLPHSRGNPDWDITNKGKPGAGYDMLPSSRWVYDTLLKNFSARSFGSVVRDDGLDCIVSRVLPLKQTLLLITAASGQGKTTLARQFIGRGIFHTSSDYLLDTIVRAKQSEPSSPQIKRLREVVEDLGPGRLWREFFRVIEDDHELLECFLHMAWRHIELGASETLVSYDIDLRGAAARTFAKAFFETKGLHVWACAPEIEGSASPTLQKPKAREEVGLLARYQALAPNGVRRLAEAEDLSSMDWKQAFWRNPFNVTRWRALKRFKRRGN